MKWYNQRVLFTYSEYSVCPYVTFKLDKEYTEEELREKTIDAALLLQDEESEASIECCKNYRGHEETRDTITVYFYPKITEKPPTTIFWQQI